MRKTKKTAKRLAKLAEVLKDKQNLLIVLQDFPDPDAIASAVAMRELARSMGGLQCSIAHGGVVGRAENVELVRYLGLNLRPIEEVDSGKFDEIAMVDTQPGTGNNSLPEDVTPGIVIDHHPIKQATRHSEFFDIRSRYGAASTILYEYLVAADIKPDTQLATALIYGIRSDTHDLGRESTKADIAAYIDLYPVANKRMISTIEHGRVPREYFRLLTDALVNARVFGSCIITGLGDVESADMLGEVADMLLRTEGCAWVLCYGFNGGKMWMSTRTSGNSGRAGTVMHHVVGRQGTGGGHNASAGGQIKLAEDTWLERNRLESTVVQRFLKLVGERERGGQRLILRAK